jgi:outer membrane protein
MVTIRSSWKILAFLLFFCTSSSLYAGEILSWEDCVHEAAEHNPDILAAQQTVQKSQALVKASRSDYFPTLTGAAGYNASANTSTSAAFNTNPTLNVNTANRRSLELGVSLNQNLFEGFKTQSSVQKSRSTLDGDLANLDVVKSQVSLDLKTAFARLLFNQGQLEVARKIVQRRTENVRVVELRFEVGRENKGSVLRNQSLLEQAQYDLAQTERALRVAQRDLAKALGRDYMGNFEALRVQGTFQTHFPEKPPDFASLVPENPNHRKAVAQLNGAKADVRFNKGNYYPSIDASASVARDLLQSSSGQRLWSAGVNLSYPFRTGLGDINQVKAARSNWFQFENNLSSGDNQIAFRLKQAYSDFRDAVENIRVQEGFLKSSEVRAEIGRSQYANGLISYQDWDIVENDLINNQKTILQSMRDALIAEANWENAQGKGAIP